MKNFALVLVVGIVLLAASIATIKLDILPRPAIDIRNDNGRFVMHQLGAFNRNRYVIDTRTGRVWTFATVGKGENEQLFPVPYYVNEETTSLRAPVARSLEPQQDIAPLSTRSAR